MVYYTLYLGLKAIVRNCIQKLEFMLTKKQKKELDLTVNTFICHVNLKQEIALTNLSACRAQTIFICSYPMPTKTTNLNQQKQ